MIVPIRPPAYPVPVTVSAGVTVRQDAFKSVPAESANTLRPFHCAQRITPAERDVTAEPGKSSDVVDALDRRFSPAQIQGSRFTISKQSANAYPAGHLARHKTFGYLAPVIKTDQSASFSRALIRAFSNTTCFSPCAPEPMTPKQPGVLLCTPLHGQSGNHEVVPGKCPVKGAVTAPMGLKPEPSFRRLWMRRPRHSSGQSVCPGNCPYPAMFPHR